MTEEIPRARTTTSDARNAVYDAIDNHDNGGDDPARIGDVVDEAIIADTAGPSSVLEVLARLFKQGEVYEPQPGHVRRTGGVRDPDGVDDA